MNTDTIEHQAVATTAALAPVQPASQGIITLDPAKYVAEVFRASCDELALVKAEAATIAYDITTTAGMKTALEWRAKPKAIRLGVERIRKERKAPILEIGKLLDSRAKEIEAEIEPIESRFDADIKREEARKEAVKAIEAARKEEIRLRVVAIRELPLQAVGKSAAEISALIAGLVGAAPDESFEHLLDAANTARTEALDKLAKAEAAQRAAEVEAEARRQQEAREKAEREDAERSNADGDCPHCSAELDLDDWAVAAAPVQAQEPVDWQKIALYYNDLYSQEKNRAPVQSSTQLTEEQVVCALGCIVIGRDMGHISTENAIIVREFIRAAEMQPVAVPDGRSEHYAEIKATLEGAHKVMESLSAIEQRVGPIGSHARGYTHKITAALRHLEALAALAAQGDAKKESK